VTPSRDLPPHVIALALFRPNLDVSFKGWMGGAAYLLNLARVLSLLPPERRPRLMVLSDGPVETPVTRALFGCDATLGVFRPDGSPLTLKPKWFGRLAPQGRPDVNAIQIMLASVSAVFPVFRTMFAPSNALHWIPDFQHKHLPHMFDADELVRRDEDFSTMAYRRTHLLLSSQAARADLDRFYPGTTAKVFVWPFTTGLEPQLTPASDPRPRHQLPEKYLFAPNQFWKHKDHLTAFKAVKLLKDRGLDVVLACTGQQNDFRHPTHFADLQAFVTDHGLRANVRFLGVVPADELLQLIRFSAAVVQPSLFEGWSTVIEDTKALGRPMVVSDLDVHREQCADVTGTRYFRRSNPEALAAELSAAWPRLTPGPDPASEASALVRKQQRDLSSAHNFVSILDAIRSGTPAS